MRVQFPHPNYLNPDTIFMDELEEEILRLSSLGYQQNEMPKFLKEKGLPSSTSTIDKRIKGLLKKFKARTFAQLMYWYGQANREE